MNFKNFYTNTEQRIIDTVLSLWATGDAVMQNYLRSILTQEDEKILAKPVFQNMFPWQPSKETFGQLTNLFKPEFTKKLDKIEDKEYRFPADRIPYLHQVNSWQSSLIEKKSILVTTGTGSGKTECFMLPVLQDIFTNPPNETGINAIFLYPLNALIGSQQKRMHAWCQALGNIQYAVYNGNTKESVPQNTQNQAYPEIISRVNIRKNPPQILFTNPTMLEYMLVRDKDTQLLQNSKGKLKWILLDEAHTLTGSKAAEMALLIRRVIDAFDVDIKNVRFAVTSATVGSDNDEALKQFMSDLCGINTASIKIIKGKRILPEFNQHLLQKKNIETKTALALRKNLYENTCLDSDNISKTIGISNIQEQLAYIDKLADISDNEQPVLPVRGHFFARNINGMYSCTNPNCDKHPNKPDHIIGSLTTISKRECDKCGYPLLELISCRTCGTYMLEGERENNRVKQSSRQNNDFFEVEDIEDNEGDNENQNHERGARFILAKELPNKKFVSDALVRVEVEKDGTLNYGTQNPYYQVTNTASCPYCSEKLVNPFHFRLSAAFLNRLMSDIILEQTDNANPVTQHMLWGGKKYISFTDSRQGTAKISALINIDSETYWLRSQVYHNLTKKINENQPQQLNEAERIACNIELEKLRTELKAITVPILINSKREQINQLEAILNLIPPLPQKYRISWQEMLNIQSLNGNDFQNLFHHNVGGNIQAQGKDYLNALLYNEFARRLPRERSLENLGMVKLVYPRLDNLIRPEIAITLNINEEEWKSLVKIALDYVIRYKFHYFISQSVRGIASKRHKSFAIYPNDTLVPDIQRWPNFDRTRARLNRLALLICAGLGYNERNEIDSTSEGQINEILEELWVIIRGNFLTTEGIDGGYKLNLEEKTAFELADSLWLCPVKKRLVDTTFRGYSPWISGSLTASNIESFKVGNTIHFPMFPNPFNLDSENVYNPAPTLTWIHSNPKIVELKKDGLWNSLHERVINFKPLYLAGEHSAQQQQPRLQQLEEKFQDGRINILSCSTTMEMGVDIGGISAVVMSNVPPNPSNYLQRTGRAGRRRENKSLAFTICAANPIGSNVISDPAWALNHQISAPMLAFSSKAVVLRHLNAFMLGKFIQQKLAGININETNENFFSNNLTGRQTTASQAFQEWLLGNDTAQLHTTINKIIFNTPLSNSLPASIINNVYSNFELIANKFNQKKESFENALIGFLNMPGYNENSPAYKAVNFQKKQFFHKNLLAYLSEEGFLPAGGIPTGVVDFNNISIGDLLNNNNDGRQLPSYHITRALSEYAPGMELVIDGWTYKSGGITLKNNWGGEATKRVLQHCNACGAEHIVEQSNGILQKKCSHCHHDTLSGINQGTAFTEIIEPAGFAVDLYGEKKREINETSNVQYVEPLLIGVEPWSDASHPVFDFRDSKENAEILHYNYGSGEGYAVCLECGRADTNPNELNDHKRLRGGKNNGNTTSCNGNENPYAIRQNVLLVGRFQTDFFEFRCKDAEGNLINNETTLYSLAQVISKSLTTLLGIEEQEVDFGIKKYSGFSSVFLFDTAKGGAGYVSQCANYFEQICRIALATLKKCKCTSACTKCLIDRRSQYHIEKLNRYNAIEWLERVVDNTVPANIMALLTHGPKKLIGTIKDDWSRLLLKRQLQQLWIVVDNQNIDNWNDENFLLLKQLKLNDIKINLVFRGQPHQLTMEQKLTLVQTKTWAGLYYTNNFNIEDLQLMARVQLIDHQLFDYFANDYGTTLDGKWGNSANNHVYKQVASVQWELYPYDIAFDDNSGNVHEVKIQAHPNCISSTTLFNEFYKYLRDDVQQKMTDTLATKKVKIVYSDRYLMTPLTCLLLIQFIDTMKNNLNFQISELTIRSQEITNPKGYSDKYITDQFLSENSRKNFIETITSETGIAIVKVESLRHIPHYRYMSIDINNETAITIRPDAGIAHGWFVREKYKETNSLNGNTILDIQQKQNQDLLYTLVFN